MPQNSSTPDRLLGYARVSQVAGREGDSYGSPDVQRQAIEARGVAPEDVLVEEDVSGKLAADDRGLGDLLAQVEAGQAAGIVVNALDRFGRTLRGILENVARLHAAGGYLLTIHDGIDSRTPNGKMMIGILGTLAEAEVDRKAAYWDASVARAIERGEWVESDIPVGYRREQKGWKVNRRGERVAQWTGPLIVSEMDATWMRHAFEMRATGKSWAAITSYLQGQGVSITATGTRNAIQSRAYRGESGRGQHVNLSAHPALVSEDVWQAAQRNGARPVRTGRIAQAGILSGGVATCAHCGGIMGVTSTGSFVSYRCKGTKRIGNPCTSPASLGIDAVDGPVLEALQGKMARRASKSTLHAELDAANAAFEAASQELSAFVAVASAAALGDLYPVEIQRRRDDVADAQAQLDLVGERFAADALGKLGTDVSALDIDGQREMARAFIERVEIRKSTKGRWDTADRFVIVWREGVA